VLFLFARWGALDRAVVPCDSTVFWYFFAALVTIAYLITSPTGAVAKYCDEHVCLSVCLPGYLRNHTRDLYQLFCACCLRPWLGPPLACYKIPKGRDSFGGFLPRWQCIVTRSLQMRSAGKRWRECTVRAKCDLQLPCFKLWLSCLQCPEVRWVTVCCIHTYIVRLLKGWQTQPQQ